jgi:hypothetical protein
MHEVRAVSNAEMEAYRAMVSKLAWRYNGHCGAEYDDLFQEGWFTVFLVLRKGIYPSKDFVAKRMRRWVSKCRQEGLTNGVPENLTEEESALFS